MTDAELIAWFKVQVTTAKLTGETTINCSNDDRRQLYRLAGLANTLSYVRNYQHITVMGALHILEKIKP